MNTPSNLSHFSVPTVFDNSLHQGQREIKNNKNAYLKQTQLEINNDSSSDDPWGPYSRLVDYPGFGYGVGTVGWGNVNTPGSGIIM